MKEQPLTDVVARKFLLGEVDEAERQRIESLFMIDPAVKEIILIAEDELVEDYLEGCLTQLDADKFLKQYAHTPRQRRKLRITESIREYARWESVPAQTAGSLIQRLRSLNSSRQPRIRRVFIPVAVALTTVVIIAAVWLVQWNNQRMRQNSLDRELTELNLPSNLRENPPQMFSLVLPPVSLRSVAPGAEVMLESTYRIIEVQLLWPQKKEYQSYVAVLRRIGGTEKHTIPNLHAEKNARGNVIRLRLPTHSLARGLYQLSLSGIASDGTSGPTEVYDFTIRG